MTLNVLQDLHMNEKRAGLMALSFTKGREDTLRLCLTVLESYFQLLEWYELKFFPQSCFSHH